MICSLPGHTDHVYALDFSHDDSFLLSGSADETVMIWQIDMDAGDEDEEEGEEEEGGSNKAQVENVDETDKPAVVKIVHDNRSVGSGSIAGECTKVGLGPTFDAKFYKDQVCRMVAPDDANKIVVSECSGLPLPNRLCLKLALTVEWPLHSPLGMKASCVFIFVLS